MTSSTTVLTQPLVSIANYLVDVTLNEDYTFDSDVTDFPVESGSSIVDNIRPKPIVVRIEGIVSNTPIGNVAQARQNAGNGGNGATPPSDQAYDVLLKIRDAREPVTITTSLRTYENMALQSLSMPRATGRGDELRFNATFKQVTIVTNKRTTRVATPGAVGNHNANGTPKPVTDDGMIKVYRIPQYLADSAPDEKRNVGRYIWFDKNLGGWRHEALNMTNPQSRMLAAAAESLTPEAESNGSVPEQPRTGWVVTRGRPFGVSQSDYVNNPKLDAGYRQDIQAANQQYADNPNANPYNPFPTIQTHVPFVDKGGDTHVLSDIVNVRRVKAMIRGE